MSMRLIRKIELTDMLWFSKEQRACGGAARAEASEAFGPS